MILKETERLLHCTAQRRARTHTHTQTKSGSFWILVNVQVL